MGSWGPAVSSNDTYADLYDAFFELYNEGKEVSEITEKLIADNKETIADKDDSHNFWFALAKCQWDCKALDNSIFNRVREIITSGSDIELWKELGADSGELKKRKAALDKFLSSLEIEKNKPKPRKKNIIKEPPFEKGDCITFKLSNNNYGGAVVLEAEKNTEYAFCLIATTRINQPNKPTKKDFEEAEILCINYGNYDNNPCIRWYNPVRHENVAERIEKVATIDCKISYSVKEDINYGMMSDFGIWVIDSVLKQFEFEKNNAKPKGKLTIKTFTGNQKSKWKFW